MLPELLPPPVLSIGLTGHRSIASSGSGAEVIADGITTLFKALQRALSAAVAQEKPFFSAAAPTTRVVTMGAEGADFLGIRAATKLGLEVCCIVPFELAEYCRDFSPSCAAEAFGNCRRGRACWSFRAGGRRVPAPTRALMRSYFLILMSWSRSGTALVRAAAPAPAMRCRPRSPKRFRSAYREAWRELSAWAKAADPGCAQFA